MGHTIHILSTLVMGLMESTHHLIHRLFEISLIQTRAQCAQVLTELLSVIIVLLEHILNLHELKE